jgi:glycosyltransferase involved in cell wall biosynthesis
MASLKESDDVKAWIIFLYLTMKVRLTKRKTKTKKQKQNQTYRLRGGSSESIALCIPMDAGDVSMLHVCLRSVKQQTRAPDSVYISISGVTPESEATIKQIIADSMIPNINVKFHPEKILAGGNRNLAASAAVDAGATILSFIDADDSMHPNRIERLLDIFKNPLITGVVHSYSIGKKAEIDAENPIQWPSLTGQVLTDVLVAGKGGTFRTISPKSGHECHVANGHVSVRAEFFRDNNYNERLTLGEDQDFNASILLAGKVLAFTPDVLSMYYT